MAACVLGRPHWFVLAAHESLTVQRSVQEGGRRGTRLVRAHRRLCLCSLPALQNQVLASKPHLDEHPGCQGAKHSRLGCQLIAARRPHRHKPTGWQLAERVVGSRLGLLLAGNGGRQWGQASRQQLANQQSTGA